MPSKNKKTGKMALDPAIIVEPKYVAPQEVDYFISRADRDDLVATLVEIAKEDTQVGIQANKFILERLYPPRNGRAIHIDLPRKKDGSLKMDTVHDYEKALIMTSGAMADGILSPQEANSIKDMLSAHKECILARQLIDRVEPIAEKMKILHP